MAKGKRRIRDEVIILLIVLAVILLALVLGWWQEHTVIGWTILAILIIAFGFSLYKFPRFRSWIFKKSKTVGEKAVFTDTAPGREPIPKELYINLLNRANNRCQNPDCKYQGKPVVHHIDQNNRNNQTSNLIALCPNCHTDAHNGRFPFSQLRNWNRMRQA
jgi:hypothetical protein